MPERVRRYSWAAPSSWWGGRLKVRAGWAEDCVSQSQTWATSSQPAAARQPVAFSAVSPELATQAVALSPCTVAWTRCCWSPGKCLLFLLQAEEHCGGHGPAAGVQPGTMHSCQGSSPMHLPWVPGRSLRKHRQGFGRSLQHVLLVQVPVSVRKPTGAVFGHPSELGGSAARPTSSTLQGHPG